MKHSESVPKAMGERYEEIASITNSFSEKYLNEEYAQIIRYAIAALCRKRPSPLVKGKASSWACGITHAIGYVNFLYDKSSEPFIGASDLYRAFGVGQSTGQGKSKTIRDLLNMFYFHPNWTLPSKIEENPMVWTLQVNGLLMDIRNAPRELQEIAYEKGLIPFIHADRKSLAE